MTVSSLRRLRLLALLVTLASAGCALQGTIPERAAPDGERLRALQGQPAGPEHLGPQVAMGNTGEAYLIWMAIEWQKSWDILFARSEDAGATWSHPPRSLKPDKGMSTIGVQFAAGPNGQLYLAWRERNAAKTVRRILFVRSTDGGRHWEETPHVLANSPDLGIPKLLLGPDGAVYVAWLGGPQAHRHLEMVISQDFGASFTAEPIRLKAAFPTSQHGITNVRVVSDGAGRLYVVWEEEVKSRVDARIYLNRSLDRGKTWLAEPILVSAPGMNPHGSRMPQVAAAPGGRVYVIWEEFEGRQVTVQGRARVRSDRMIYANRSLDSGQTWLAQPVRLNEVDPASVEALDSMGAQIECDERGNVYVAWIEADGPHPERLLLARSADSGATWVTPRAELGRTSPFGAGPMGAVLKHDQAGHLWVLWQEKPLGSPKGWHLLMNRSEDHGQSWHRRAMVLSGPPSVAGTSIRGVSIVISSATPDRLIVSWDQGRGAGQGISVSRSADRGETWMPSRVLLD